MAIDFQEIASQIREMKRLKARKQALEEKLETVAEELKKFADLERGLSHLRGLASGGRTPRNTNRNGNEKSWTGPGKLTDGVYDILKIRTTPVKIPFILERLEKKGYRFLKGKQNASWRIRQALGNLSFRKMIRKEGDKGFVSTST